jgi:hypothetical protein
MVPVLRTPSQSETPSFASCSKLDHEHYVPHAQDPGPGWLRGVPTSNTVILGVLLMLFATIGVRTPVWLIVLQAFCYGTFSSLQYTGAAGLATAFFIPARVHTNRGEMIHGIHQGLLIHGGFTILSTIIFQQLRSGDGSSVSQQKVAHSE